MLSYQEVGAHCLKEDCWVIIHGKAYNVSDFIDEHPGGAAVILKYAGKDATKAFDPIHPSDTLTKYLPEKYHLGPVDPSTKPIPKPKLKKLEQEKEEGQKAEASVPLGTKVQKSPLKSEAISNIVDEYDVEYDEQGDKDPIPIATQDEQGNEMISKGNNVTEAEFDEEYDEDGEPLSEQERLRQRHVKDKPDLSQMYNLHDFEYVAKHTMEKTAWAYYSSGADDEIALRNNHLSYHKIFLSPKVLVNVSNIDLSTTMLGTKTLVPFYITATALGKLGHPDGEKVLTRSAAKQDVIQMIPTLASCSFDEIMDEADGKQTQWFQLYVNSDREITKALVQHAERRGIKGLFITVDAPQLGRREKDMRSKNVEDLSHVQGEGDNADRSQGAARAISSFIDTSLNWEDLEWFRSITQMPIILKGVQSVADSLKAIEHGVDGIVLSNHGGRQLDSVKAPIEILALLNPILRKRGLLRKISIFIDGGVRRASDILKAIALGATGVGIGRPFLYAMSTYGDDGVYRAIQILKDEMVMNMRLLGAPTIQHLDESFVDVAALDRSTPEDRLFSSVYEPLEHPEFKSKL
ncbi:L-lactate dehydrogenase cytochrome [Metschnikowia aff. pulcherrima]|uniref:L-lactate dehydrogenase (cytochrome) n=1 Tax=Metschnikowia aff. pulcherrima TaxID=2163413 RepID=A0A4V1AEV7_9ASCO|nr:L-lactate dehydrogenase cytochrome [Metschnikowia aff. pulcherrima]